MIRFLTILLLSCLSLNAAIPIIFTRPGTNAVVVDTNTIETDIFIVEAEDFNANSGVFKVGGGTAFNVKSLYYQSNAVRFIDHNITPTGNDNIYRAPSVDVGTVVGLDPEFIELFPPIGTWNEDTQNYHVYPWATESNDWMNYTRIWTNTTYNVYARIAHSATNMTLKLSRVTSDRTVSNQTETVLGHFTNASTGSLNTFTNVELRTNGIKASIALSGTETVRLTHEINWSFQASVNHIQFRRLEPVTTDAFVNQHTGTDSFVSTRSAYAYRGTQ